MYTIAQKKMAKTAPKKGGGKPAPVARIARPRKEKAVNSKPEAISSWSGGGKAITLEGKFDDITERLPVIVRTAMKGVKTEVFYKFAALADMPDKFLADLLHISTRTLSNYKDQKKTLEPVKGEHLLKLIALFKKGEAVFGRLEEFRGWLLKPFSGKKEKPVEWLVTPGGVDLISLELDRIAHGYAL
jgi:putative toxin-antitoxin system antitoxin component (TIGR02293 family)